ncbi:type III-B CRISPR module-associated protein Cmr5 [Candidatus Symbiobacter mobilis]|uniref:CRISPR type III-B/RAMP module-associated protein Cmr5 n=1 Tax=Candidatus Symbiobacter mobilis CR TaxID=946483 RepID=U5N9K7_9BURK|nr:type III-B CRISPR module-associated protein Cmr5 [Candidatus Symbiobacter mobilis]AGX86923.1 CRISPR-associated protein Cmr5 [Candidatus Symbiobacter mobilis CR]
MNQHANQPRAKLTTNKNPQDGNKASTLNPQRTESRTASEPYPGKRRHSTEPSPTGGGQGEGTPQTLDQQRAKLAWGYAQEGIKQYGSDYKNLAKGAPALIMGSGLMPTMAFYEGKKSDPAKALLRHLICGLHERIPTINHQEKDFPSFMKYLQNSLSQDYLRATDEALELLKWIRQFVDALGGDSNA